MSNSNDAKRMACMQWCDPNSVDLQSTTKQQPLASLGEEGQMTKRVLQYCDPPPLVFLHHKARHRNVFVIFLKNNFIKFEKIKKVKIQNYNEKGKIEEG